MSTVPLRPQANGLYQGWFSLTGDNTGWKVLDDSEDASHDGDLSSMRLNRLDLQPGSGRVSFPLFLQTGGLLPISILLRVAAKRGTAAHPRMQIGFARPGGALVFSGSLFTTLVDWSVTERTFSTNPFTSLAWQPSDLIGLESCLQNEAGVSGSNDVTLFNGSLDYTTRHNFDPIFPKSQSLG